MDWSVYRVQYITYHVWGPHHNHNQHFEPSTYWPIHCGDSRPDEIIWCNIMKYCVWHDHKIEIRIFSRNHIPTINAFLKLWYMINHIAIEGSLGPDPNPLWYVIAITSQTICTRANLYICSISDLWYVISQLQSRPSRCRFLSCFFLFRWYTICET